MMKKQLLLTLALTLCFLAQAQLPFPVNIDTSWTVKTVWMPKSPLKQQVIFVGGVDTVQTTATYGNPASQALAKQWHDYIAFVRETNSSSSDLGWVIVNHEMTTKEPKLGDGGGMTMFKLKRKSGDVLEVVNQTLADGRKGKFFNVDFVNTVGETGMNCGGINSNGRVWTAEEWMQSSNSGIYAGGNGFTDTSDFIIGTTTPAGFPGFNGKTIKRFQNLNWMVEIDAKNAKAIRKQYNWGRAGWEGGVVMPDNKTVYLFEDASPGILAKFVATTANDFTSGQLYVYKHDAPTKWISIENNLDTLMILNTVAMRRGATMFNRLEWGQYFNGKIYICETGRDNFTFTSGNAKFGVVSPTLVDGYKTRYKILKGVAFPGTDADAADSVRKGKFFDYYGRVIEFDPATNAVRSYIEGGPLAASSTSQNRFAYPPIHLSNPDGIDFAKIGGKDYMIIQEDLNGITWNRMPGGLTQTICETYLLDMSIPNPNFSHLIRITACAPGAEITGAVMIDENTMLVNSQHPSGTNTYPYNNSLTYAISGFQVQKTAIDNTNNDASVFTVYPNPTSRELHFNTTTDVAVYNANGQRILVARDVTFINVENLEPGVYFIRNAEGVTQKFIIQ
ncbi:MAG: T9SS type A sorting domain-containing protein [Bacteroidetes bacterium]|nr:T9SS type A sorting domain-containing protein [Bacteroidota bacterium]